jgi:hypothetical protein
MVCSFGGETPLSPFLEWGEGVSGDTDDTFVGQVLQHGDDVRAHGV